MKKITAIFSLIIFFNSSFALGKDFVIGYPTGTESPLLTYSKNIITEMYKRIDIPIKFKSAHATRSLVLANVGKADGELLRVKGLDKKFKNLMRIEFPIVKMTMKAITLNSKKKIVEIKELHKYPLAFHRGFQLLEKIFKNHKNLHRLTNSRQVYKMVNSKRIDYGVIIDELSGHLTNNKAFKNIKKININFPTVMLYHYINRKHIHLAPKLLKALNEMKEKKVFQKLKEEISK
jgi:polar amino acid transport system substrate-binding protein